MKDNKLIAASVLSIIGIVAALGFGRYDIGSFMMLWTIALQLDRVCNRLDKLGAEE